MQGSIKLADGRTLSFETAGPRSGFPVVVHHGTPSSQVLGSDLSALADDLGLLVIGFDRAGYGRSSRKEGRSIADVATDVAALADHLGLDRIATWGISGGGPHALATAALLGARVVATATFGSVAPYDASGIDFLAGMGDANLVEFGLARDDAAGLRAFLEEARPGMIAADPASLVGELSSLLCPADMEMVNGPFVDLLLGQAGRALSDSYWGWYDDDLAFVRDWGFDLAALDAPVRIYMGSEDAFVPVTHGRWLASAVPGAEYVEGEGDGHFSMYSKNLAEAHLFLRSHF